MKKGAKKTKSHKRAPSAVRARARKSAVARIAKPAAELFVKGVLVRGEAARAVRGKLPPGVTHEIVGKSEAGLPILKRRRFSLA